MNAGVQGGEFTTHPLVVRGNDLVLNYATSAAGSIQVEVQDVSGRPLPGYAAADMPALFGDELDATVSWRRGADLAALQPRTLAEHTSASTFVPPV